MAASRAWFEGQNKVMRDTNIHPALMACCDVEERREGLLRMHVDDDVSVVTPEFDNTVVAELRRRSFSASGMPRSVCIAGARFRGGRTARLW